MILLLINTQTQWIYDSQPVTEMLKMTSLGYGCNYNLFIFLELPKLLMNESRLNILCNLLDIFDS